MCIDSRSVPSKKRKMPKGKRFQPGQSGNKGGRPKGFAKLIRETSEQGHELVAVGFAVLRGVLSLSPQQSAQLASIRDEDERETLRKRMLLHAVPTVGERMAALDWLRVNGWGKAPEAVMDDPISEMTDEALWGLLETEYKRRQAERAPASAVTQ